MDGGWLAVTAPVPAGAEVVVVETVVVELVVAVPEVLVAAVVEGIGSW